VVVHEAEQVSLLAVREYNSGIDAGAATTVGIFPGNGGRLGSAGFQAALERPQFPASAAKIDDLGLRKQFFFRAFASGPEDPHYSNKAQEMGDSRRSRRKLVQTGGWNYFFRVRIYATRPLIWVSVNLPV
jgi:hypothetical protein